MWTTVTAIIVMGWAVLAVFAVERQARIHRIRLELEEAQLEAARRDKYGIRRV
jgi:hypothetical protein